MVPLPHRLSATLAEYSRRMSARFGARLRFVRLFGSWARAEAHECSDLDVAVVVAGLTREEWSAAVGEAYDVDPDADFPLAPFVVSAEHFDELLRRGRLIAADIVNEGMPL